MSQKDASFLLFPLFLTHLLHIFLLIWSRKGNNVDMEEKQECSTCLQCAHNRPVVWDTSGEPTSKRRSLGLWLALWPSSLAGRAAAEAAGAELAVRRWGSRWALASAHPSPFPQRSSAGSSFAQRMLGHKWCLYWTTERNSYQSCWNRDC